MNNTRLLNNLRNKNKMESSSSAANNTAEFTKYDNTYYNNSSKNNNNNHNNNRSVHNSYEKEANNYEHDAIIPQWKVPLSKSFSSAISSRNQYMASDEDSNSSSYGGSGPHHDSYGSSIKETSENDGPTPEPTSVIQILLPCIICNRTFSPEALERHSKICTKVNVNDVRVKAPRQTFDSARYRIKDTKLEFFIPPPRDEPEIGGGGYADGGGGGHQDEWAFTRGGRGRSSFQDKTNNTRFSFGKGSVGRAGSVRGSIPPAWRRAGSVPKSDTYGEFDDTASSINMDNMDQPSYSRTLSPSEDCPYCGRSFGMKAFDRHVNYCKEIWERKQYEIQPTPKEVEIARLRQEVRTKYKPMKGSSSWSSLRSFTSPSKDFAQNALNRLFGGLKRVENINLHGNKGGSAALTGFKKSNESLASSTSCYGDFNRQINNSTGANRKRNPSSPSLMNRSHSTMSSSLIVPGSSANKAMRPGTLRTVNSNIPQYVNRHKSTENLDESKTPTTPTLSSGYGPGGSYMSNFSRNSKGRSSLNKNYFFRNSSNRVEPEGTENNKEYEMGGNHYMNTSHNIENSYGKSAGDRHSRDKEPPPLIITPMNFYTKSTPTNQQPPSQIARSASTSFNHTSANPYRQHNNNSKYGYGTDSSPDQPMSRSLFSKPSSSYDSPTITATSNNNSNYDPYEKAAKQLEELFRKQPPPAHSRVSNKTQRKIGLDRAFASVLGGGGGGEDEEPEVDVLKSTSRRGSNKSQKSALHINEDDFGVNANSREATEPADNSLYNWEEFLASRKKSNENSADLYYNDTGKKRHDEIISDNSGSRKASQPSSTHKDSTDLLSRRFNSQQQQHSQQEPGILSSNKSARASNTSSADSAFSRSDGTDLEFEALESLLELGQMPSSSSTITTDYNDSGVNSATNKTQTQEHLPSEQPYYEPERRGSRVRVIPITTVDSAEDEPMAISSSSSSSNSSQINEIVMSDKNSYDDEQQQQQYHHHRQQHHGGGEQQQRNEQIISTTITPNPRQSQYHPQQQPQPQYNLKPMMARFCHECGTSYPTGDAKFCPECGERRVIHV